MLHAIRSLPYETFAKFDLSGTQATCLCFCFCIEEFIVSEWTFICQTLSQFLGSGNELIRELLILADASKPLEPN